jgi:glycerate kinase
VPAAQPSIPRTLLIAAGAFGADLDAARVASAIAAGLREGGWETEACSIEDARGGEGRPARVDGLGARMLSARAVVIAQRRLHEDTLAGSAAFELATHARQSGIPAYAVTAQNLLDSFDARILDLQTILEARTHRSLRAAGRKLAALV